MSEEQTPTPKAEEKKEAKSPLEWFQFIQNFADKLTIKRILVATLSGILLIAAILLYENRIAIFEKFTTTETVVQSSAWSVSDETKQQLTTLIRNSPLVKMASINEVDLQKNRRILKWFYLEDPEEASIRLRASALLAQPVFDYDPKNTQQMVNVLNNDFSCVAYQDTYMQRLFPELATRMPAVCRIAVPPFYGRFAGILTFGLTAVPTKNEQDSLRLEASRIAVEIYLRDVVKKPVPGGTSRP